MEAPLRGIRKGVSKAKSDGSTSGVSNRGEMGSGSGYGDGDGKGVRGRLQ